MAVKTNEERVEAFEEYNPYAASIEPDAVISPEASASLAVAYELSRLRAELHFNGKRGGSQ